MDYIWFIYMVYIYGLFCWWIYRFTWTFVCKTRKRWFLFFICEYFEQVAGNTNAIISMISCGSVLCLKECYKLVLVVRRNGFREINIFQFCITYYCAVLSVNVVLLINKYKYSRGLIYGMAFSFMAGGISCFIKPRYYSVKYSF